MLAEQAVLRNLIPVFGAGFSVGSEAASGSVPDCDSAIHYMIDTIKELHPEVDEEDFIDHRIGLNEQFTKIADSFFEYVPWNKRREYFEFNFTGVELPSSLIHFLSDIEWPYAYTLNFDDSIERNADFTIVLPYKNFHQPFTSKRLLYKLHGDANWECNYPDENSQNIVFSSQQYIQAINDSNNQSMRNSLQSDLRERYVIFIGCSLSDEADIRNTYESIKHECSEQSKRIILRTSVPSVSEERNLRNHGISDVLLVTRYEDFYPQLVETYLALQKERNIKYSFYNPQIKTIDEKNKSLQLLASGEIFDLTTNSFQRGNLQILRSVVSQIVSFSKSNCCIILKGRRFSGKTAVLCDVCKKVRDRDKFYFPQTTTPDEEIIQDLFENTRNSLFLFDSNTVSSDVYHYILRSEELLLKQNHTIIIAINSSDNYLATRFKKIKTHLLEISSIFSRDELTQNRMASNRNGISNRRPKDTNADYLYLLNKNKMLILPEAEVDIKGFSNHERVILIVLAALEKVYSADLLALGITNWETGQFISKITKRYPIVEYIECTPEEATKHSRIKIVHNSKIALLKLINLLSDDQIVESISYIVNRCRSDYSRRRMYIDIILVDTLNQLFNERNMSGQLINHIYESLEPELYNDLHFWLQRAKFLYRFFGDKNHLETAYRYAKKVHDDGGMRDIKIKSALNLSLICCALAEKERDAEEKLMLLTEAIYCAHEAVFSDFYRLNPKYLCDALAVGKSSHSEERIKNACNYFAKNKIAYGETKRMSNEILNKFKDLERENKKM